MLHRIQQQLIQDFSELKEKRLIVQYYISLDCPEKQRRIVNWWSSMIEAAIRRSKQIYLSPAELETIFSLHGLKPVPLPTVLKLLQRTQNYQWRDRISVNQINTPVNQSSVIKMLVNYIFPKNDKNLNLSKYKNLQHDSQSKVISMKFLGEIQDLTINQIEIQLGTEKNISYDYIIMRLKNEFPLNNKSIQFVLEELSTKSYLIIDRVSNKKVIFYAPQVRYSNDKKWIQIQKQKFNLKSTINEFNKKIDQKTKQQEFKLQQAKKIVEKDKEKAKKILIHVKNTRTTIDHLSQRVRALKQALDDLQMSEANNATIDVMKDCQQLLKTTMKDPAIFEQIIQKNQDIKLNQKEMNERFDELNNISNDGQIEDQVDNMMAELQKDIIKNKKQKQKQKQDSASKFVDDQLKIQETVKRPPSVLFRRSQFN